MLIKLLLKYLQNQFVVYSLINFIKTKDQYIQMIYLHNRQNHHFKQPILLTERGVKQAGRNNSDQIWSLFNECSTYSVPYITQVCVNCSKGNHLCKICGANSFNMNDDDTIITENQRKQGDKDLSEQQNGKKQNNKVSFRDQQDQRQVKNDKKQYDEKSSRGINGQFIQERIGKQGTEIHRKSIEKYLKKLRPYTRELPNSAFTKFYQKPCPETYGSRNTSERGIVYGNYMKSHNVQPHSMQNKPQKYQTYVSALNFSKRTKLDPQDRWMRIQRQLSKNLNLKLIAQDQADGVIQLLDNQVNQSAKQALKYNIGHLNGKTFTTKLQNRQQSNSNYKRSKSTQNLKQTLPKDTINLDSTGIQTTLRRSKSITNNTTKYSRQPFFIYKYTDKHNQSKLAKDRHGITCYCDPTFDQNKQAYTKFLKTINPIFAEDVRPQDYNIDKIRIANYLKSKQEDVPKHYLMPNVQIPYEASNYSFRKNKKKVKQDQYKQSKLNDQN